jgi:hypothetical protein
MGDTFIQYPCLQRLHFEYQCNSQDPIDLDLRILKKLTHFSLTINGTYNDQPPQIQFPDEFSVNFKIKIPQIKWNMGEN